MVRDSLFTVASTTYSYKDDRDSSPSNTSRSSELILFCDKSLQETRNASNVDVEFTSKKCDQKFNLDDRHHMS